MSILVTNCSLANGHEILTSLHFALATQETLGVSFHLIDFAFQELSMPSRRSFLASAATIATSLQVAQAAEPHKSRTKFAVNVEMWWPKLPFLKKFDAAAQLGFEAVEIWPWRRRDASVEAVAEAAKRNNLKIVQFTAWGFSPGMNDPKNKQKVLDEIAASCETAKKWDCQMMCVVAGNDIRGKSQAEMHATVIDTLKAAAPIAEKAGVTLILEPMNIRVDHKGHCLYGSEPTMRIIKEVGSPNVKINWDLYHMHITEGDLCGHLREGMKANAIGYIQIADHPGRHEPGTGEIYYPRVFKELASLGYKGYVGLELSPARGEEQAAKAIWAADAAW
jgi:hydroxypyruvate isomerase